MNHLCRGSNMGRSAPPPERLGPCRAFGVAGALRFAKRAHALGPLRLAYGEPEAGIALAWNFSS
jgi:hypothetical protein